MKTSRKTPFHIITMDMSLASLPVGVSRVHSASSDIRMRLRAGTEIENLCAAPPVEIMPKEASTEVATKARSEASTLTYLLNAGQVCGNRDGCEHTLGNQCT